MDTHDNSSIADVWARSRSGARAGFGLRFQDAATTAAAVLCWTGGIQGNAIVPEGIDDFSIEGAKETVHVQVKSKISDRAGFLPSEIADILVSLPATVRMTISQRRQSARSFSSIGASLANLYDSWSRPISDDAALSQQLAPALAARTNNSAASDQILSRSALVTWPSPIAFAAQAIATKRGVSLAAGYACAHELMVLVGQRANANAAAGYAQRAKLAVGEIDREVDATLRLIDDTAISAAIRKGIVEQVDFGTPLVESGYYLGVATQPGHVAAGLTISRHNVTETIIDALFRQRRVLVAGPSGAGKNAQAPSEDSPLVLYIDDAGSGNGDAWSATLEASLTLPSVYVVASARERKISPF